MPIDSVELAAELVRLRRGRAMLDPGLPRRLEPQTRAALDIGSGDKAPVIRRKAAARIAGLLRRDAELRTAALAALGLHPEADQRLLKDREAWLAAHLMCDSRTARRRVTAAMQQLVDALVEDDHAGGLPAGARDDGYTVRVFWATMRLAAARPELHEKRRIIVTGDRLDAIAGRLTVPRSGPEIAENDVLVRATSGGDITGFERCSPEHFQFVLRLPRPLHHGEIHEYGLVFTIPPGQPMRPHYVFQPLVPCERFELTVHFDRTRLPDDIWLINGVAPRLLDHDETTAPRLTPNARGTLRRSFTDLRQGRAYGVRWRPA